MTATILRNGLCACQACVPSDWDDDRIASWVNTQNPSGVTPWRVHDPDNGDPRRVVCADDARNVHVVLVC